MKKQLTITEVRDALKSEGGAAIGTDDFDEVCRMAIEKMMAQTEWLHRAFTDEEIKNAIAAARQACLEGALQRGDAWLCVCGQINGNHNSRCCHCTADRTP
jgi:hypothetical protein